MNKLELDLILEKHLKFLKGEPGGERANLSDANFSYANLSGANLSDANLSDANFSYANLSGANFSYANLSGANLSDANLSDANLSGAILRGAILRGAILSGAILSGTNLREAIGNSKEIFTIQTNLWPIVYTDKIIAIGCKQFSIDEWLKFDDETINAMDNKALTWWKIWKPIIIQQMEINK